MGSQAVFLYLPFSRQWSGTFGRLALRTSGFPLPSKRDIGFPLTHNTASVATLRGDSRRNSERSFSPLAVTKGEHLNNLKRRIPFCQVNSMPSLSNPGLY